MIETSVTDLKNVCIKPGCKSMEFSDLTMPDGSPAPAKKCKKCGVVSTIFDTTL